MSDGKESASTVDDETVDVSDPTQNELVDVDEISIIDEASGSEPVDISDDAVVALIAERDEYLDALQRLKADFANARRRNDEQAATVRGQAAADLVEKLLPVLDSCEAALGQGIEAVRPISDALFDVLTSKGLGRLDADGQPFDPELHEAVLYEEGEGEQVVVETLRTGYVLNDRVIRPAMVKVRG